MEMIARMFAEDFSSAGIVLPDENLRTRTPGHIKEAGWLIQFCFGEDEAGAYLDYYACHRMVGGDDHFRLHKNGTRVALPALQAGFVMSDNPLENQRREDQFLAFNRKMASELVAKGFTLFTVNMALYCGAGHSEKHKGPGASDE